MADRKPIDFSVLRTPLYAFLGELDEKLAREWPMKYKKVLGAQQLFIMHFRVSRQTLNSALYLCGDTPADTRRKPEFAISLPLLNRALLDSLFTLMFIMEDVPNRCSWFWESDWREARLDLNRYIAEYNGNPEWQDFIAKLDYLCKVGLQLSGLTPEQTANPKKLRSWPTPGAMWNNGISQGQPLPPGRAFMKYLDDFIYIDLSQQAHLGGYGLSKRAAMLLDDIRQLTNVEEEFRKYRNAQVGMAIVLVLSIASEIQSHFRFGLKQDLPYLWTIASAGLNIAEEFWRKRYKDLFPS